MQVTSFPLWKPEAEAEADGSSPLLCSDTSEPFVMQPAAAAASMAPPSPSPARHFQPPELPLPSALLPPKKRRVYRTPPKATTPIPPPPPVPAAAAGDGALPFPTPTPQDTAVGSPSAAGQKSTLPPPRAAEKPSLPPPPTAQKPSSSRPPPPVEDGNPSSPPPSPTEKSYPSPPPTPTDAAANRAPARKVRKRKTVRKVVPKGTIATREASSVVALWAAAGMLQLREGHGPDEPPTGRNAASDEMVVKEQNLGGTAIKEPATGCNSVAVCEAHLGKGIVGGETIAGELVMDSGDARAPEVEKLVSRGEVGMSEGQRRWMTEVFVGGLSRDATEEDVRKVLGEAGEITEVRMIMDAGAKKNKGFCFVRYHEAAQARKAITEFGSVKICGKPCRVAAVARNDKIFLGNINKEWRKEDIMKLLQKIGVENIDAVTLMADCNNPGCNRGFAFLELETYRDAQIAYKKLSKKDVFGNGLNIKVEWAEPLDNPDEKQMQKVKTVFVEGVPNSWDQAKMTKIFKKYGKIEVVVLSRDMRLPKRNDIAFINYTTHEAAILCVESFDEEQLTENGSKVNIKVALAKSDPKGKKNMDHQCCVSEKDTTKIPKSERKLGLSSHILPSSSRVVQVRGNKKHSTTNGLLHVLRELAPWRHGHNGSAGSPIQDYRHIYSGEKRPFSALSNGSSYFASRNTRVQHESSTSYAMSTSSYGGSPHVMTGYSSPYHHDTRRCLADSDYWTNRTMEWNSDEASRLS